jgi:hypothetical protein
LRDLHTEVWPKNLNGIETSFERSRRRWEENIRMDLGETGWKVMDWMHLSQDSDQWRAAVNTVMNFQVP